MENFAEYILAEEDCLKKMDIVYYLQKRTGIFFDNSVIFKTQIAKFFIEIMKLDVDENLVLTACLLYDCKKNDSPQNLDKVKTYPKLSAEFLKTLGFSDRFCKICEEHSRYSNWGEREKESDLLELVDQFGGMLLHRPERMAFSVEDAICLLEYRNLKGKYNRYLEQFKDFVRKMEGILVW